MLQDVVDIHASAMSLSSIIVWSAHNVLQLLEIKEHINTFTKPQQQSEFRNHINNVDKSKKLRTTSKNKKHFKRL